MLYFRFVFDLLCKIDLGEGQFALRAFSNGRFLRVNPPAQGEDDEVWFLEVGPLKCWLTSINGEHASVPVENMNWRISLKHRAPAEKQTSPGVSPHQPTAEWSEIEEVCRVQCAFVRAASTQISNPYKCR